MPSALQFSTTPNMHPKKPKFRFPPTPPRCLWGTPLPWFIIERKAIAKHGGLISRAIMAIFHARCTAGVYVFCVTPDHAKLYSLSPTQLNWALSRLEGSLIVTIEAKRGGPRLIRLFPEWEGPQLFNTHRDLNEMLLDGPNWIPKGSCLIDV